MAGTRAVRWGWVTTKVVAVAQLGRREQANRGALEEDEVRRALTAVEEPVDDCQVEPATSVALRAAVTGARRSELCSPHRRRHGDDHATRASSLDRLIIVVGRSSDEPLPQTAFHPALPSDLKFGVSLLRHSADDQACVIRHGRPVRRTRDAGIRRQLLPTSLWSPSSVN